MMWVNVYSVIMTIADNSVNTEKPAYHHGDLRSALIAAGLDLLSDRDLEGLSLREVARAVGVSAPSVYRHFPDKQALMTALAMEGLAQLSAAQHEAVRATERSEEVLAVAGRAYVRFALANPALFRLIFASSIFAPAKRNTMISAAGQMMRDNAPLAATGFFEAVAGLPSDPETLVASVRGYAIVHGLATLMLDGQIVADDSLIDSVIVAPKPRAQPKP